MDLVGYSEESFAAIRREFDALCAQLGLADEAMIPVSALEGDNVVTPSARMPWYEGPTLLEYLETVPLALAERLRADAAFLARRPKAKALGTQPGPSDS